MKSEVQRAARFVGFMFVGVGVVGVVASIRHGLNTLAVLVGVLGVVLLIWSWLSRPV